MAKLPDFIPDTSPDFIPDEPSNEQVVKQYQENQAKYGDIPSQALAGLAGVARGATLGASDVALTKSGLVNPETLKGLAEANPITSTVGNVAGGAGLVAGTGGISGGATALGRIGANALEGAAFGAGSAATEYSFGDNPNLDAQKIAAHIGQGALFGAGLGAVGEAAKVALPKSISKLKESTAKIKQMAGEIIDGVDSNYAEKIKLGLQGEGAAGNNIKEFTKNLQEMYGNAKQASKDLYDKAAVTNLKEALKETTLDSAKVAAKQTLNEVDDVIKGMGEVTGYEVRPLLSNQNKRIFNELKDRAEAKIFAAKDAYEVQEAAANLSRSMKKIVRKSPIPTPDEISDKAIFLDASNKLKSGLENSELWGNAAQHYKKINSDYAAFSPVREGFEKTFMLKDPITKKYRISPAKVSSYLKDTGAENQIIKNEVLNRFVTQADEIAKASENHSAFKDSDKSISKFIKNLTEKNEEIARVSGLMKKTSTPETGLLGKTYNVVANPYETGLQLSSMTNKVNTIGNVIKKSTQSLENNAKAIFDTTKSVARQTRAPLGANFDKLFSSNYDRIQQLANSPQDLQDHLEKSTMAVSSIAPGISTGLHAAIISGVQFLNSKLPRPGNELPMNAPWKPTPSQKMKFNQYVSAVNDPIGALKQVKDGTLSNETMEALQVVHPDLLQQMRQSLIANMVPEKVRTLPYSTKISLSKFMGQPLENSMLPNVMKFNQSMFNMPGNTPPKQRGGSKSVQGTYSDRFLTPMQKSMFDKTK